MNFKVAKSSLQNSVPTTVPEDTSVTPNRLLIPGLLPINENELRSIEWYDAIAEVRQQAQVGVAATPTVVAGQKYQFLFGNNEQTYESYQQQLSPINYTAPAILTGTAANDRVNMYTSFARQINSNPRLNAQAQLIVTLVHATDVGDPLNVGEVVTGATSGATGIIISRADVTHINVAQTIGSVAFVNGENIDDETGSGPYALTAGPTVGVGLWIRDNAGYYAGKSRAGVNTIVCAGPPGGLTPEMFNILVAGARSVGDGSFMIANQIPVVEVTTENLSRGYWEYPIDNPPVATHVYAHFVVRDAPVSLSPVAIVNTESSTDRVQVLWVDKAATNYAAFKTDLLSYNP